MVPFCAVTTTSMTVSPTASAMAALASPLATSTPFTVTVAPSALAAGVTVTLATAWGTATA